MSRIANETRPVEACRPYRSALRERQAEETRDRILDAAIRVMARGIATLSIPDVAREAGVSVPTVYRHFGTKQELLDAIYPHTERRAGLAALELPASSDRFREAVLVLIDHLDAFDDVARAAMASPAAEEVRHRSMPRRIAMVGPMVDTLDPPLPPAGRDRIVRLVIALTSSSTLRAWLDHLEVPREQVADEIDAVFRAAVAAERERAT